MHPFNLQASDAPNHRVQYYAHPYIPQPQTRTKQGLSKGYLELLWALFWLESVWLGVVFGSFLKPGPVLGVS